MQHAVDFWIFFTFDKSISQEATTYTIWPVDITRTQLSLGKADRTAYVRRLASDFWSQRESNFRTHTRLTLLSNATVNAKIR